MPSSPFRRLGPVHAAVIKLRTSDKFIRAKTALGQQLYRIEDCPGISADISSKMGMGALLGYALRLHALAEDKGLAPTIVSSCPLYTSGPDLFGTYFERPKLPTGWRPHSFLATEWLLHKAAPSTLRLARAQHLFARYFVPKKALLDQIGERYDLSVHFRGTDKFLESGRVHKDRMILRLRHHLAGANAGFHVFLATDDPEFADLVRAEFPRATFTSFETGTVAAGVPRHFSDLPVSDKALEALVNIYRLASAPLCLRTSSYLSAISRVVNPALLTETINIPPGGSPFPEDQIERAERELGHTI